MRFWAAGGIIFRGCGRGMATLRYVLTCGGGDPGISIIALAAITGGCGDLVVSIISTGGWGERRLEGAPGISWRVRSAGKAGLGSGCGGQIVVVVTGGE